MRGLACLRPKPPGPGLSGISCAAERLTCSGHRSREPFTEENGELGLGHTPLARRHDPLLLGAVQDQEKQLGCGLVAGEMPPGPDRQMSLSAAATGLRSFQETKSRLWRSRWTMQV
jgi:hypothetical protein